MGHRLSKIYTRTGDSGKTALGDGIRVDKDSDRVEAYGTVDELNSVIGMILSYNLPSAIRECLSRIQHELFDLGSELCLPDHQVITATQVSKLEQDLDRFNTDLPHLREFVLPGGGRSASTCHLARTTCRRAERRLVSLGKVASIFPHAIPYLNRLSDLLFVIARVLSRSEDRREIMWNSRRMNKP